MTKTNELIMNPRRLEQARPDLWPEFLQILLDDEPKFHEMIITNPTVNYLMEELNGKLMINVSDFPKRAQDLIYLAMNEAQQRAKKNG